MKTKHQYLLLFYWVALLADCYFIFSGNESERWISKSALMPILLIYYFVNASKHHHLPSRAITIAALTTAWIGDMVLLRSGETFFIIGLGSFLVLHVLYIIYFGRIQSLFPVKKPQNVWLPLLAVAIYDVVIMKLLLEDSDAQKLRIPLMAYMIVLSLMFVFAFNTKNSKKAGSLAAQYFIPGAIFFIISDSLLGLNLYLWEETIVGVPIMLTYGYAQQLMVHGFIKHVKGKS